MAGWNNALNTSGKFFDESIHNEYYLAIRERMDIVGEAPGGIGDGYWDGALPPTYPLFNEAVFEDYAAITALIKPGANPNFRTFTGVVDVYFSSHNPNVYFIPLFDPRPATNFRRVGYDFTDTGTWGIITTGATTCNITSGVRVNNGNYIIRKVFPELNRLLLDNGGYAYTSLTSNPGNAATFTINGNAGTTASVTSSWPEMYVNHIADQAIFDDLQEIINSLRWYEVDLTGTVSVANGGTAVTGIGTAFTTELTVGDYIQFSGVGSFTEPISAIANDTNLTIGQPAPAAKVGVAADGYRDGNNSFTYF